MTTVYMNGNDGGEFYTRISDGATQVKNGADGDHTWAKSDKIKPDTWNHITFLYRNKSVTVYHNGKPIGTIPTSEIYLRALDEKDENKPKWGVTLGNDRTGSSTCPDYARELRFWSRALSETEINDMLYEPLDPNTKGLEIYLPLSKEHGGEFDSAKGTYIPKELKGNRVEINQQKIIDYVEQRFPSDGLNKEEKDKCN